MNWHEKMEENRIHFHPEHDEHRCFHCLDKAKRENAQTLRNTLLRWKLDLKNGQEVDLNREAGELRERLLVPDLWEDFALYLKEGKTFDDVDFGARVAA